MAEEAEETRVEGGGAPDTSGLAIDLAMEEARDDPALREDVARFLRNQNSLVDVQKHHLHEQFKQLRLATFSQRLTIALKLATGLVGVGVIAGLGLAVWNARHAGGLVVESFAVPPKFAEAGVSGAVLSDDINSKLATIRDVSDANSLTRSSDVSANRDDDFKVEIPETGVSLSQAWRYLRLWFGHERRLSGNLRDLGDGRIALTATLAGDAFTVTGPAADLDKLEQQAAEHVYQQVDPINYVIYLGQVNRAAEIAAAAQRATEMAKGDLERANAFGLFSAMTHYVTGDIALAAARARIAIATAPNSMPGYRELGTTLMLLGQDEEALQKTGVLLRLKEEDQIPSLQGRGTQSLMSTGALVRALETGDFAAAAAESCVDCRPHALPLRQAEFSARAHDLPQSRSLLDDVTPLLQSADTAPSSILNPLGSDLNRIRYFQHAATGDWRAAAAAARAEVAAFDAAYAQGAARPVSHAWVFPLLVVAEARSGELAQARKDADAMPADCYACLRAHGVLAGVEHNWAAADWWFARAVKAAPSIPYAYEEWGQSLLTRGKPDEAIAQFTLANAKGPHFADAIEGWGEALMAKNQSHLAVAKFAAAEKFAPNWGRLQLKWGEALYYAGKKDEAARHLARAADLTPSETAERRRFPGGHS